MLQPKYRVQEGSDLKNVCIPMNGYCSVVLALQLNDVVVLYVRHYLIPFSARTCETYMQVPMGNDMKQWSSPLCRSSRLICGGSGVIPVCLGVFQAPATRSTSKEVPDAGLQVSLQWQDAGSDKKSQRAHRPARALL